MPQFVSDLFIWLESLSEVIPPVVYAPAAFLAWIFALWVIKRFIVYRLRKWAAKTPGRWDDAIVESLSFPANFLIFASGLTILANLLPLPDKVDRLMTIALQGSVIFAVVFFCDSFLRAVLKEYASKTIFGQMSEGIVQGLVRGFVIGIGALIFLDLIGISITPILASLGVGSLAVALALQDTLSNFFAGIYVAVDKPVQIGDFVRLESGEEGHVIEIGWRSTRLRTPQNNVVIIPNSKLMGSVITNFFLFDREIAIPVEVGVHYDSDLRKVERVARDVAREVLQAVPSGVKNFEPQVRFHTFADSSVNFTVVLRAKEMGEHRDVQHEFIMRLHERFRKEGIVIPYPIRTLEFSKESVSDLRGLRP
jgi:small-conductance mechanosensitive channel